VAGVAALIKSKYPGLSPELVDAALTSTAVNPAAGGYNPKSGFGTVDAAAALTAAAKFAAVQPGTSPEGSSARFGGGPTAVPAAPVAPRGAGRAILYVVLGLVALGLIIYGWRRLARSQSEPDILPAGYPADSGYRPGPAGDPAHGGYPADAGYRPGPAGDPAHGGYPADAGYRPGPAGHLAHGGDQAASGYPAWGGNQVRNDYAGPPYAGTPGYPPTGYPGRGHSGALPLLDDGEQPADRHYQGTSHYRAPAPYPASGRSVDGPPPDGPRP
jgi:hypothetical protein